MRQCKRERQAAIRVREKSEWQSRLAEGRSTKSEAGRLSDRDASEPVQLLPFRASYSMT